MTLPVTTVPEPQCTKIVKKFVLTTEFLNVAAATSIEIQFESGMPVVTSTAHSATNTGGVNSLLEPSNTSDPTGTTNNIVHSSATTLLTTSHSDLIPFPTQKPIETSTNSTGGNSRNNIIPAAVGGALSALAVFVLLSIYAFLRQRRQRRAQCVDDQTGGKGTRHAQSSQDAWPSTEEVQSVRNVSSRAPNGSAITKAIKTLFSGAVSEAGSSEERSARAQKYISDNRHQSSAGLSNGQTLDSSALTPLANPFSEGLTISKIAAQHGSSRDEDLYSEHSNPFNLDRDSGTLSAQVVPWGSTSNVSQYSRSIGPRSTNSSFAEHRMSLRGTNSSQWRADRGMSTHSDPFDLEKL